MTQAGSPGGERFRNPPTRDAGLPVSFPATAANVLVLTGDCVVTWWAFTETTGAAPASITVFDGQDASGQEVVTIDLIANESTRDDTGARGIYFTRGIFVKVNSGSVRGTFVTVDA